MDSALDILFFRRVLAPIIMQVLFWTGIGGALFGSWWLFHSGHWAWSLALVFGTLMTRLIFELGIIAFRSYEALGEIRDALHSARQPR